MLKNFEAKDVNVYYEDDEWKMTFYVKKPQGVLVCGDSEVERVK